MEIPDRAVPTLSSALRIAVHTAKTHIKNMAELEADETQPPMVHHSSEAMREHWEQWLDELREMAALLPPEIVPYNLSGH